MIAFLRFFDDGVESMDIDVVIRLMDMVAKFMQTEICTKDNGKIINENSSTSVRKLYWFI